MLDCNKAKLFISMFIDGELSENEEYELKQHFKECKECENEFNYINDIVKNLNELPEIELPKDFHENLMNNIKNVNKVKRINWKFYSAIAAGFIILFVALDFYSMIKYNNKVEKQNEFKIVLKNKSSKENNKENIENSNNMAAPASIDANTNQEIESYAADTDISVEKGIKRSLNNPEIENTKVYNNMIVKRYDIYLKVENYSEALKSITDFFDKKAVEIKNLQESISGKIYKDDYDKLISELEKSGTIVKIDITEEDKNEIYNKNKDKLNILFAEIEKLNNENNKKDSIDENLNNINKEITKYNSENYDIEFNADNPTVNINLIKK